MKTKEENLERAALLATMIIQSTSVAVLFLRDYQAVLNDLGRDTRHEAKRMVTNNAEKAISLMVSLEKIEKSMIKTITSVNEEHEDHFLNDVGFMYNLMISAYEMCHDSEQRRDSILKKINTAYKTKLKEIR